MVWWPRPADTAEMMSLPFQVRFTVRSYELDTQGHLNSAVYHQYGEQVRWEYLRAAGTPLEKLFESGVGAVQLESTIRFRHELRAGDEVDVSCGIAWGDGKTFQIAQEYRRADGTLVAELRSLCGLLDLTERRLIPDPRGYLRSHAAAPEVLGLADRVG
jgi:acyl-CoA thioester hydrolase